MAGSKIAPTDASMKSGLQGYSNEYLERVKGVVFDIQRFSLHDGPGLRTSVFLKGCPLRCKWCSNPESQDLRPELAVFTNQCIRCGQFEPSCSDIWHREENISWTSSFQQEIARRASACPGGGIRRIGEHRSAASVINEAGRDTPFYLENGGITLTGGEPLFQTRMAEAILRLAKMEWMSTAMETCGYAPWTNIKHLLPFLDQILFDLKHIDNAAHQAGTGASNELILANLRRLSAWPVEITVRIPLIPGFNATKTSIMAIADFLTNLESSITGVDLLPYHNLGKMKYVALGRFYPWNDAEPLCHEQVLEFAEIFKVRGFVVNIGG
jgi:pyruvate formate lyase activating enzyme